ncbi:hypothetical protein FZEAL_3401 [Fusarium zealandicum]|uniref:Aegerolysin n=1 Tax=Fusarium zealandicum TaxID=1053134 RepID=A0A8H4UNS4_9HYPO|nr:hypothetical protein FZEAL_3401 [Fusarium zealandicum]
MAYAQWVAILIQIQRGMSSNPITIKNINQAWGKFFAENNKDKEISADDVKKASISSGNSFTVASCGRSDASSGTEGSFELWDGEAKICKIYWSCPWGSKTNTFTVSEVDQDYIVQNTGANLDSGALGNVTVKVGKF